MKGLLGRKLGMTGLFGPDGRHIPVTVLEVGPCVVTQVKTKAKDGYDAVQVGFGAKKAGRVNKPLAGHAKKSGVAGFTMLREFPAEDPSSFTVGDVITASIFSPGDLVDVAGRIKGRGFAGVIKRHGFSGGKMTHGCTTRRKPGSIGASAWPSRVIKGKKMPGQYGNTRQTAANLLVVEVRAEENLVLIRGAVPGATSAIVEIRKPKIIKKK